MCKAYESFMLIRFLVKLFLFIGHVTIIGKSMWKIIELASCFQRVLKKAK
jgi:hypothetical protein